MAAICIGTHDANSETLNKVRSRIGIDYVKEVTAQQNISFGSLVYH